MPTNLITLYPREDVHTKAQSGDQIQPENCVDIVAVHGIGEDLYSAWTDKVTGLLWLRDLLPKDIEDIRVLSFGYSGSADSFFRGGNDDPVYPTAETLISALRAKRAATGCKQRPIIFICHGLGGLVVKQALLSSFNQRGPRTSFYHHIYICTYAIVFFGTPHGRVTSDAWIATRRFSKSSEAPHTDTNALTNINRAFMTLLQTYQTLFLWEEAITHVDPASAAPALPDTEVAGIPRDHNDMCKFSRRDASDYLVIMDFLRRQVKAAPEKTAFRWQHSLQTLHHEEVWAHLDYGIPIAKPKNSCHHRHDSATMANVGLSTVFDPPLKNQQMTSEFVGRTEELTMLDRAFFVPDRQFESSNLKVVIVYGMGGTGKTALCSQFAQRRQENFHGVFSVKATSKEQIASSFAKIGTEAGFEATEKAGRHALSQQLTRPFLFIIDNADDPNIDLPKLFPDNNNAYILVTTRNAELCRLPKTVSLELQGLKEDEALRLLLIKSGINQPWDDATEELGHEICKTLGYLALALVIAGSCIQRDKYGSRLREYLDSYDTRRKSYRPSRLRKDSSELAKDRNIQTAYPAFDLSLDYLERQNSTACRDAIEILNIVGFYHFERIGVDVFTHAVKSRLRMFETRPMPSISTRFLNGILGQPPTLLPDFLKSRSAVLEGCRVEDAIAELASLSLIRWEGEAPTFSLHPLVHAWAQDRLEKHRQPFYAEMACNTLLEGIVLPTGEAAKEPNVTEDRATFQQRLVPHLDACLKFYPLEISFDGAARCSWFYLLVSLVANPRLFSHLEQQVLRAAKSGLVYGECGKFQRSAEYLEMVKAFLLSICGPQHPRTMVVMLALAKVYWGLGELDQAINLQKLVVDSRKRVLGPYHVDTLLAMDELGRSHWLNGQYTEALEISETSMTQMKSTLGPEDDRTLAAMDNYGVALASWHRFRESADIHREVLATRETRQGPKNLDTLASKNNLAMALLELKQFDDAQSLMTEVFEERKKQLGKEHPWTLWALCWLAKIRVKMGLLEEAEEMLAGGIKAGKRSLDKNHLGVLMGTGELARVYARQGHLNEAIGLLSDTVSRLQTSRGVEHPDSFYALWKLSVLQGRLDKIVEAHASCKLAFERALQRLTDAHPLVGMIKLDLERFQKRLQSDGDRNAEKWDKQPGSSLEAPSLRRRFLPRTQLTW